MQVAYIVWYCSLSASPAVTSLPKELFTLLEIICAGIIRVLNSHYVNKVSLVGKRVGMLALQSTSRVSAQNNHHDNAASLHTHRAKHALTARQVSAGATRDMFNEYRQIAKLRHMGRRSQKVCCRLSFAFLHDFCECAASPSNTRFVEVPHPIEPQIVPRDNSGCGMDSTTD